MPTGDPNNQPFDLTKITAFNPALIYGFDPEASCRFHSEAELGWWFHGAGQYQDVFNAYWYAQQHVLSATAEGGIKNITQQQILDWIDQIHLRIAATLAEDNETFSGKYAEQQIVRWKKDAMLGSVIIHYFSNQVHSTKINALMTQYGVEKNDVQKLLDLYTRVSKNKTIVIPEKQRRFIHKNLYEQGTIVVNKMFVAYHKEFLTAEEKTLIDKYVKVCMSPSQYKDAMQKFAGELLRKWQQCDVGDLDQVAHLAGFAFYELTEIHPYFNGNGRTATCLMNIILRSLGYPSILLRNPGERDDPRSSYSNAIAMINTETNTLQQHIKQRIKTTQSSGGYSDQVRRQWRELTIECVNLILTVKQEFPHVKIDTLHQHIDSAVQSDIQVWVRTVSDKTKLACLGLRLYIDEYTDKLAELRQSRQPVAISAVVLKQYTPTQKQAIVTKLTEITGHQGWKVTAKNGFQAWLALSDENTAQEIVQGLCQTNTMLVELRYTRAKHAPLVLLSNINWATLKTLQKIDGLTEQQAEPNAALSINNK